MNRLNARASWIGCNSSFPLYFTTPVDKNPNPGQSGETDRGYFASGVALTATGRRGNYCPSKSILPYLVLEESYCPISLKAIEQKNCLGLNLENRLA